MFVSSAQSRLTHLIRGIDTTDQDSWREIQDLRHSFVNVVVSAAKRYGIDEISSWHVPLVDKFGDIDYRQFQADIDHFITQLAIENSLRNQKESVTIPQQSKEKIRDYVRALRQCVENSQMSDVKRDALLERINEFERELDKQRLTLLALTRLVISVATVPGALWASYEISNRLVLNVIQIVGEAKDLDDQSRAALALTTEKMKLSPPRPFEQKGLSTFTQGSGLGGMDDDIPF